MRLRRSLRCEACRSFSGWPCFGRPCPRSISRRLFVTICSICISRQKLLSGTRPFRETRETPVHVATNPKEIEESIDNYLVPSILCNYFLLKKQKCPPPKRFNSKPDSPLPL